MDEQQPKYYEELLHRIWESLYIDVRSLETVVGKPVDIIDPGRSNNSDGPDFINAKLQIGPLYWHGDIEIHRQPADWYRHSHHTDPAYNGVILHIVFEYSGSSPVKRKEGTEIPTLHLEPFIVQPIRTLLRKFSSSETLPCTGNLSFISGHAFKSQIEKAHKEYFNRKTEELLEFYNTELPPSDAWTHLLITGLFDGLGISLNRKPMVRCCNHLLSVAGSVCSLENLIEEAYRCSGLDSGGAGNKYRWRRKGVRPANRPAVRLRQAVELMWEINRLPTEIWIQENPDIIWKRLLGRIRSKPGIGRRRSRLLYAIVVLPALYLFGSFFGSASLQNRSYQAWLGCRVPLPQSLAKVFKNSDIPEDFYRKKLGAVHQLKHYCRAHRCLDCKVLKHAINS